MIERIKMEKRAIEFREKCGLDSNSPINFFSLLEKLEVITLFTEASEKLSGMALKVADSRFMLINCKMPLGKQNFTIAHELYHLFIQEHFKVQICLSEQFDKADKEEFNADLFATYFLLPNDGILRLIPEEQTRKDKITLDTILKIEQLYRCSRTALTIRLKELGLISEDYRQNFLTRITSNAIKNGYPGELYQPTSQHFIGEKYQDILEKLYDKELIKETDYLMQMEEIGVTKI